MSDEVQEEVTTLHHSNSPHYNSQDQEVARAINEAINPPESYVNGVYWADLPVGEKIAWENKQFFSEAAREFGVIWQIFKKDPLEPFRMYQRNFIITGMGMFVEGWVLFSIGNVKTIFSKVWPACWKTYKVCHKNMVFAVDYMEIIGIMCGQVLVGFEGDWVGRKFGMIQDASIMAIGTIMLIGGWGTTFEGWIVCYAISLFVYGIGVGGEYPMTATRALERLVGKRHTASDKLHRGRNLALAFLMQGWGQFCNIALLIVLLLILNGSGSPPYSETTTQWLFRLSFVPPLLCNLWMIYYRYYKVDHADTVLNESRSRAKVTGYDTESFSLLMSHFYGRVIGTAGSWFCNDFFFYGNKIFQGAFLAILSPKANVAQSWLWTLLNTGVSLAGYYIGALLIDYKPIGRVRMQLVGFLMCFICFIVPDFDFGGMTAGGIHWFQFFYFFSSFWNQCGPNVATFLLAAEIYPASVRSTAHGISAMVGKSGALVPTIIYNYVDNRTKFKIVPWFGLLGAIITWIFIPDITGLDLREQEIYWEYVRAGRFNEYHGPAVNPRHLSIFERYVLHRDRNYNPELDRQAKLELLSQEYSSSDSAIITGTGEVVDVEKSNGKQESDGDYNPVLKKHFRSSNGGGNFDGSEQ